MALSRRGFIGSVSGLALAGAVPSARAQSSGPETALIPDADVDQTATLQAALEVAASGSGRLVLPVGRFRTGPLRLPSGLAVAGVPGATVLVHAGAGPLLAADGAENITLSGLVLDGADSGGDTWHGGLVHMIDCTNVTLRDCRVSDTRLNGISLLGSSGRVESCAIARSAYTGIFVYDAQGVVLTNNTVADCGNGGIRVWRGQSGPDGTIVIANRISGIDWTDGGNGQNGNGINVFRADEVILADNHIAHCSFSAIRVNATNNAQITGNVCRDSLEVAIFSEFEFSGSVISGNIIDGAGAGISMTNYGDGGRLATCTGNIVRNLYPHSQTNPDLDSPYGIAAEADAVVSGNLVDAVPGIGILVGWGPYLRDVVVTGNLVRDAEIGIAVSVAPGAGPASVSANTISGAQSPIVGAAWGEIVAPDLAAEADRFPHVTLGGNTIL